MIIQQLPNQKRKSYPIPRTAAVRVPREADPDTVTTKTCGNWHLYIGSVNLFIVGDARKAWLKCSEAEYRRGFPVGTQRERAIAEKALAILRTHHRLDPEAGPTEIRAALTKATQQYNLSQLSAPAPSPTDH